MRAAADSVARMELPEGTVTFVFSDIDGSTSLLRQLRGDYGVLLRDHARLLGEAIDLNNGHLVDTQGDAVFAVFRRSRDAVAAAAMAQHRLAAHQWPQGVDLRVRMGLHTGEPLVEGERYVGLAVHRAASICSVAHGGQVLLSAVTRGLVEDDLPAGVELLDLGRAPLKDFDREEHVFQLTLEGLERDFPPPRTAVDHGPFDGSEDLLASRVSQRASGAEVRLLGPVEAVRDGQVVEIGAAKQRMILAMLALRPGQVVSTDALIDALWGERPPATATKALQVYVSELRDRVEPQRSTPTVVISHPPGYRLGIEAYQTDLGGFEQLWERGRSALATGEASEAAVALAEAAALWRGQPLGDLAYESAFEADAARLEEMRLACLEDRFDADLLLGRHAALVPELQALTREHPLRERLRGQHMLALYRCDRQADALAVYQDTREALVEQLGIDPSHSLVQLERQILQQDAVLELAAAAPAAAAPVLPRERVVMVVSQASRDVDGLLEAAQPLAQAGFDLVLGRALPQSSGKDSRQRVGEVTRRLAKHRERLAEAGVQARVAAFASGDPGGDLVKLATHQDAELVLVDGTDTLVEGRSGIVMHLLNEALCDVALHVGSADGAGDAIVVPFGGNEHDWAALELAALMSRAEDAPLLIAGSENTEPGGQDASRLLATAGLILQRTSGIVAEPVLVRRGAEGVIDLAPRARQFVIGLSPRFRDTGLGEARTEIASRVAVPALFVRRGTRPGVLAPERSVTRFSWSLSTRPG
jgi:DNA-binding SARP family transcriptional activator/class 3 adenylate cyclase